VAATCEQDLPAAPIADFFEDTANFIERALSMRCGLVFICCYMGNSRCATIAAAYLMLKKDYSATQALQYMRNSRQTSSSSPPPCRPGRCSPT
jgi:protein-tyrosine phosphatase